jgi:hypothetical protein
MTLTYEWAITSLKKMNDPSIELNDIIVQTYWTCKGIDEDGYEGIFTGATPFDPDQVDPDNFTTYENLTEEQIIGWIRALVESDEGYWGHINKRINEQIFDQKGTVTTVSAKQLPWNDTENKS